MTIPGIFLGMIISSLCALLFHVLRGGKFSRFILYTVTAWISFFLGHLIGQWLDWHLLRLGTINLFPALLATFVGLFASGVLAGPEYPKRQKKT
jgi:hypothetical protein